MSNNGYRSSALERALAGTAMRGDRSRSPREPTRLDRSSTPLYKADVDCLRPDRLDGAVAPHTNLA